jgi:divinyl chlorophyllide a 8-vinyl-reductase
MQQRQPATALLLALTLLLSAWNLGCAFQGSKPTTGPDGVRHHQRSSTTTLHAKTTIIAGATGYIGRSVVRESVRQGYTTIALVRDKKAVQAAASTFDKYFRGAILIDCDVTDEAQVIETFRNIQATYVAYPQCGQQHDDGGDSGTTRIDAVISCLASRSGVQRDADLIDYRATLHCLTAGQMVAVKHFVLLSAFCVKNPLLQLQRAKLKFEAALTSQSDLTYTIVRPTAFFKSVSGQLEVVQSGAPYFMFGNGDHSRCNPIAESDLATYLVDCITDETRNCNRIINLGGPDAGFTIRERGKMLFEITGQPERYIHAPVWILDVIINALQLLANLTRSEALEDAAETARIGRYYAIQDMWTTDPSEKYGTVTLRQHYERIAQQGQEYDPYTTVFHRARGVDVKTLGGKAKKSANILAATNSHSNSTSLPVEQPSPQRLAARG